MNNAQELESDYPYHALDEKCAFDAKKGQVTVKKYHRVEQGNINQLKAALTQGPVGVSVDASGVFKAYTGGILDSGCGTNLNHAILAVGYGSENGTEYWIVRNSWGPAWGEQGYIRIAITGGIGTCGI